jgi:RNA polymerase-binding transcription factor DksA
MESDAMYIHRESERGVEWTPNGHHQDFVSLLKARFSKVVDQIAIAVQLADSKLLAAQDREHFENVARLHERELFEIRDAIRRVESDSFGYCDSCESPLSLRVLRQFPCSRFCAGCLRAEDARSLAS